MALEKSILKSTKTKLNVYDDDDSFDQDLIDFINGAFSRLRQLGIGPASGFMIEDDTLDWDDFTTGIEDGGAVKTYVYLKVRLLFDPPQSTHHLTAVKEQITELEHTLLTERNLKTWATPSL